MDDGDCAERQNLQMPEKRRMPGQKLGQERVELRRAVVGINIPEVTGGLQGATGTYSVRYFIALWLCLGWHQPCGGDVPKPAILPHHSVATAKCVITCYL